jgi:gamma-glutamylaminecyclotransferase
MKVFVYGTLKRAHGNYRVMEAVKAQFLREDAVRGILYASPGRSIPFLKLTGEELWVPGEVFEVDAEGVARLDRFEGHPNFYQRTEVRLRDGEMAHVYVSVGPAFSPQVPDNKWPYGDDRPVVIPVRHTREGDADTEQV